MIPLNTINRLRRMKSQRIQAWLGKNGQRPCYIWSGEHGCWWMSNGCGYTSYIGSAGIYTFSDAFDRSCHAGQEKKIYYQFLPTPTPC